MFIDDRIAIMYSTASCAGHNLDVAKESRVGAWCYCITDIPKDGSIEDHLAIAKLDQEVYSDVGIPDVYRDTYNDTDKALEILAAINAIKDAWKQGYLRAVLYTDSKYVYTGITKWVHGWRKNNWRTKRRAMAGRDGRELKNKYLWIDLYGLVYGKGIHVTVEHVSRKDGIPNNNLIVEIAENTIDDYFRGDGDGE